MTDQTGTRTLRDYLGILRRRRGVIVAIVLAGAGIATAGSFAQDKVYEAESSLRVKDVGESLNLVGLLPGPGELPAQAAAQAATTLTQADVIEEVKSKLALQDSVASIQDRVVATQDPRSNLIVITASAPTGKQAAELANAVVQTASVRANEDARKRFADTAEQLVEEAESIDATGTTPADERRRDLLIEQAARLEGLGTVTRLAEVVQRATIPTAAASPKPAQSAFLGAFIGLFVALIAVGILEALDRRLRDPNQAHEELGWPLLGLIPDHVIGGVPVTDTPASSHVAAMDSFRMLKTNLGYLNVDSPPRSVLVTSSAPEEGKTTVATGLALASAASGRRTLLLEADLHRPVHAKRLGLQSEPGLAEFLSGQATPAEVLQSHEFKDPSVIAANGGAPTMMRLDCVVAGKRTGFSSEILGSDRFASMLTELRDAYDLVVIDSAPLLAVAETLEIVPRVDAVLFCVRLVQTTLDEAHAGREALARLPDRPTGLAVNGLGAEGTYQGAYYSYGYSYRLGHEAQAETTGTRK